MNVYRREDPASVVSLMRLAAESGFYTGLLHTPAARFYFDLCTSLHVPTSSVLIFTRDTGHHTSGWFKNPDYERCYHLSVSFRDALTGSFLPHNQDAAWKWVKLFFRNSYRLVWSEPPYSRHGKQTQCWHYRVFCDERWYPIKPRGEVYSRELTEAGWKSFSEIHGEGVAEFSMGDPS